MRRPRRTGGAVSVSSTGIDAVLQAPPPLFSAEQACEIGRAAFGIEALSARSLGSERDQAFLLAGASGAGTAGLNRTQPPPNPPPPYMEALGAPPPAPQDSAPTSTP